MGDPAFVGELFDGAGNDFTGGADVVGNSFVSEIDGEGVVSFVFADEELGETAFKPFEEDVLHRPYGSGETLGGKFVYGTFDVDVSFY